ncbi:hypothetical protein ACOMHN_056687 [Nucella lapillus]
MSSVVEPDKENKEQQTVSRKAVVCDSSAPRTPFADVNRQRCVRGDLGDGVFKPGQPTGKPSRTSDCLLQRQSHGICDSHFTPLRNRAKDTSLRPSLPIEKDIECSTAADQLLPVVSQSCPDMLMSIDLPLASIGEASAEKLAEACLFPGDLPALSPEHVSPCTSPDLSLVCEESTPLTVHNGSCRTESDADVSCGCAEDLEKVSYPETSQVVVSESLSYSVMSGEDDGSEAGSPRGESFVITCDSQEVVAWSPCPQADTKNESEAQSEESVDAARFVLEDVLKMVEETVTGSQQRDQKDSNPISVDLPTPHGQTFLSEYAHFVELYSQADSPTFANTTTGSLTDVTPISQDCEVQSSASSVSCSSAPCENPLVVVDSLSSFLSDSDESFSSTTTVQRHLTFEDGEMKSPETNLDDSFGFVRSSESRFDLREHVDQKGQTERGDSVERDFLNLSISEQKVEFIALPPRLKSVASSPIDPQSLNRSCSPVSGGTDATLKPALLQDAETMTVCAETTSTSVSPLVVPVCDRSTITVALPSPVSETTTPRRIAETNSIALSPMPVSVREQEANTSVTETLEVYTMTLAPPTTSEVALSPMAVARREVGTMTSVAATTEVGMGTEQTDCLDRSMLAAAEVDSKTTMTDSTGHRTVCTTMTPFKTMVKEGRRLTSDDIRKQHPRALANQMETLMVANSRMESQALQQKQEHKRLQGLVKEAKQLASSRQAELEAVDHQKREKWEEKEREQKERCQYLEQLSQEQQGRVASLEQELSALRAESEATALRQTEDLIALQERCRSLEGTHDQSEEQHRLEIEEMKKSEESDGYRHHFERAQQMVREREAELSEIRELFSDLQTTACKQEKIYSAYEQMHKKIITLASENRTLRDSIANRTGLSREEAEEEQREIAMLQQDKAYLEEELTGLKSTMTLHTDNLAELEKLYSASSVDVGIATGRLAELNSQLFAAEAAVQQAVVSKEALALQTQELEEQLCSMQGTENSLRLALHHTQAQLHQQALAHEKLQSMSQKMKRVYEDKLENMALGVENLQRTLDNREMDMNHLEKDLYECRNIIVEQRYKIDGLQSELREVKTVASAKKVEEEDIENLLSPFDNAATVMAGVPESSARLACDFVIAGTSSHSPSDTLDSLVDDDICKHLRRCFLPGRGRPPALPEVQLTNRLLLQLKLLQAEGKKSSKDVSKWFDMLFPDVSYPSTRLSGALDRLEKKVQAVQREDGDIDSFFKTEVDFDFVSSSLSKLLGSNTKYFELHTYIQQLERSVERWRGDASELLDPGFPGVFGGEFCIVSDMKAAVYKFVSEHTNTVKHALEVLMRDLLVVMRLQLVDFLSGGKYGQAQPPEVMGKLKHCPITNLLEQQTDHDSSSEDDLEPPLPKRQRTIEPTPEFTRQGEWVAVFYDQGFFIGQVTLVENPGTAHVSFLENTKSHRDYFRWLRVEDVANVDSQYVFRWDVEVLPFFKKSNSFLEAERSLYVESLRDLEERLQATSQERTQQQQVATVAQAMVEELQQEKLGLISELSHTQTQLANASKELSQAKEEQERVESVVMASANDLLQHMRLMLTELKKKIGLPEVPEAYPADNPQPPQVPHHLSSKPIKSRRHSRKSFVSSILGAITKVPGEGGNAAAEQDSDYWESGSYLGEAMTDSVRKAISAKRSRVVDMGSACKGSVVKRDVKEVTVMTMDLSFRDQGQENPDLHSAKQAAATISTGRRKLSFSNSHNQQPMSVSWTENLCQNTSGGTGPHRFYHVSSSLPGSPSHALLPPSLEPPPPPSSAVARVRSIPRTEYHRPLGGGFSWSGRDGGEEGIVGCVSSLKEVFSSISRLAGILNRATQLSLQDLREENDMLRERTEILEDRSERNNAELMVCREEVKAKDTAVLKLQQQCQEMTEQMMNFTDHRFQIRRLRDEVKRLESLVHQERCEKEVVSAELDHRLLGFDTSSSSAHGGGSSSAQARCVHDVIALKKKNLQLVMQLEEQREHYEEQGSKAARRMRVLDENWKKAEDELYRLDELVESVKQIAHRSSSPASDLQHILHLIEGETKSSPL